MCYQSSGSLMQKTEQLQENREATFSLHYWPEESNLVTSTYPGESLLWQRVPRNTALCPIAQWKPQSLWGKVGPCTALKHSTSATLKKRILINTVAVLFMLSCWETHQHCNRYSTLSWKKNLTLACGRVVTCKSRWIGGRGGDLKSQGSLEQQVWKD